MSYSSAAQSVAGGQLHGHCLASPVYISEMQALKLRPRYAQSHQPFNQSLRDFCTANILSPSHMEKEWGEIIKQLSILSTMRCEPASLYNKFLFSPQKPFQTLLPLGNPPEFSPRATESATARTDVHVTWQMNTSSVESSHRVLTIFYTSWLETLSRLWPCPWLQAETGK